MTVVTAQTAHPEAGRGLAPEELRRAFAHFPQGVVAIAGSVDGEPEGLVAATFTVGVSLEPPLVTFAAQHSSRTWPRLRESAPVLGVSVIGADQPGLCRQIGSKDRANRFTGVAHRTEDDGAVLLEGTPLWLTARIYDQIVAGDHDIVVLEVLDFGAGDAEGLVFHRSGFKSLTPLDAAA